MIFEKDNKSFTENSALYRNILEYLFEEQHNKPFRFTDLAKFLMNNNKEFKSYYSGSKSTVNMNTRTANHRQRIQRCIDNLIDSNLLIKVGMVKAEKNESLLTPIYAYTIDGVILALLCSYYNNVNNDNKREAIRNKIFEMIFEFYSKYNSNMADFVSKIYSKAKQKGYAHSIVVILLRILTDSNITIRSMTDVFNWALYIHMERAKDTKRDFFNIYIETLNELDEPIRRIILYHEKAEIESRFHLYQPPRDWEEMWIKNINEYSKLVLYGACQNQSCLKRYPILFDYFEYRKEKDLQGQLKRDCKICNAADSFYVYDTLEKKEIQAKLV